MEPKDSTGSRLWVEAAGEPRLVTSGLIAEREQAVDLDRVYLVLHVRLVLERLWLDPRERCALLFGLDNANRLTVNEEDVVSGSSVSRNLSKRYALAGPQVWRHIVLYSPASAHEHLVNANPRPVLWLYVAARDIIHRICVQCRRRYHLRPQTSVPVPCQLIHQQCKTPHSHHRTVKIALTSPIGVISTNITER